MTARMQMQKRTTTKKQRKTKDRIDLYFTTMFCGMMAAQAGHTVELVGPPGGTSYVAVSIKDVGTFKFDLPEIKVVEKDISDAHRAMQAYIKAYIEKMDEKSKKEVENVKAQSE